MRSTSNFLIRLPRLPEASLVCFVYLAVILDVYSRKAIGYALSRNLDTKLTLSALRMAVDQRNPPPDCIHHSDRGVQYASKEYIKELEFYQFQISMSRKGNPYDNAFAESFRGSASLGIPHDGRRPTTDSLFY
jgi:transposase InsO family protein